MVRVPLARALARQCLRLQVDEVEQSVIAAQAALALAAQSCRQWHPTPLTLLAMKKK
jgi:hypothetical protein